MRKVAIIGCGGSGKSTLAVEMGRLLRLPVFHLDSLFWKPGWAKTPRVEWAALQEKLCLEPLWIMDGNYGATMDLRLAACDTAIFLDLPGWLCLWRAVMRSRRHRGRSRPDMAEGCPERMTWEFARYICSYGRSRRPGILQKLEDLRGGKRVEVLRSKREVDRFLGELKDRAMARS